MRKFILIAFMMLLMFSSTVYSAQQVVDDKWKKVVDNIYIDPEGIIGTEDRYGYSFILKSYNKGQYEPIFDKDVWYTLSRYTIDCTKQRYKIGVIDSYGYENNFIYGDYNRYAKFQPIVQGTAVSSVAAKLCR